MVGEVINQPVPHTDSREMQPLPWKCQPQEDGRCISLSSPNDKEICSFWGGDSRHPRNFSWCTTAQMVAHAAYGEHAMNAYPFMQGALEHIYAMEDMPEEAIKAIESVMEKFYYEKIPPYVGQP